MWSSIVDFFKKAWEWIVLFVGLVIAYLVYMDPKKVEDFRYKDGKLEGKAESEQKNRRRAERRKQEAQEHLDDLEQREKKLTEKLKDKPQHQNKSKEELRDWIDRNYGS